MKPLLFIILFIVVATTTQAQVKIGSNPTNVNPNAVLDLEHVSKGLLLPRLNLSALNNASPLSAFVAGMLIYNTSSAGTGANAVYPGIYYCDGTQWQRVKFQQNNAPDSNLYNSDGTLSSNRTVSLGSQNLTFNSSSGNFIINSSAGGKVGVGTINPQATLHINGGVRIDSLDSGQLSDSIITVNKNNGQLRAINASNFVNHVQKVIYNVLSLGQTNFITPEAVNDINKVQLFRNGVQINFTQSLPGSNIITAEVPCDLNDEIKIIQIN